MRKRCDRRVVVTGWGWMTPHGSDPEQVWSALESGRSAVRPITRFDTTSMPVRYAAEVPDLERIHVGRHMPDNIHTLPVQMRFALAAAADAAQMADLDAVNDDPTRLGVYMGCGEVFQDFEHFARLIAAGWRQSDEFRLEAFIREALTTSGSQCELEMDPGTTAAILAGWFNAQGPHGNCTSACASSSQAIGEATDIIRRGDADMMLAGGAHSMVHPFGVTGFHRLGTLAICDDGTRAMRPFDRDRCGFVIGEGAAVFVLEAEEHARRRGAEIWGEVRGYGAAQDAYRITDVHPEGAGAVACINQALQSARVNPEEIDYINAHGTSTVLNDATETLAIKRSFGAAAPRAWISSTKSMLGHATTAGGALEFAACLMTLRKQVVAPTVNYETPDPACDLDYVPNIARRRRCRHILSNSFGFGGQNVALVVSEYQPSARPLAG
ncbi:MAG: beta-ketoacyl-[acyl-carrier-protein] synthase family protein [Planctomycetales bacterium]|nr:beta-ketoacyl-[acyl-carrier-protein] synthase family protein [Planctomycetales bacterium]